MEVEGKALHMRKEVAAQLIDEALADSSHDVRVVIRKKAGQHRNYKCCDAGSIENLGTRKRGTVQPGADEWTRVGLRESTRSITTLSGHGRKTVNTASNNIATKASSSGVLWGRRRGRKWSIQFLQGLETLEDGPFIGPGSRPQTWHGE